MKRFVSLLCATSIAALSATLPAAEAEKLPGKSKSQLNKYLADKPAALHPHFTSVAVQGERNAVLNFMRTGLAAMELGADAVAAQAFDEALLRIETVYADNANAAKARSKFVKESKKDFKGEPYERAMAFYYRGLLYLRAGDYENARASFRGGQLQDAFAEDATYASDIAFFDVLSGWSSQCLGDASQAQEFYDRALAIRPTAAIPQPDDRVLLLADVGTGPYKSADGKYMENLRFFQDVNFPERSVTFTTPEINDAVMQSISRAQGELLVAADAAKVAGLTASMRESRATAAEAEAELAEIALRAAPVEEAAPEPSTEPAPGLVMEVSATTPAQQEAPTQPGSGPQEAPVAVPVEQAAAAQSSPAAPIGEFSSTLNEIISVADAAKAAPAAGAAMPEPSVETAPKGMSAYERLALAAQGAREFSAAARLEANAAREAANAADAIVASKQQIIQSALAVAASIGAGEAANAAIASALPAANMPPGVTDAVAIAAEGPRKLSTPLASRRGENMYWQASTRGGRPVDGILAGKAEFKANTAELASQTADAGLMFTQTANTMLQQQLSLQSQGFAIDTGGAELAAGIGVGLMLFGAVSGAMSAAAKPQADIRYWDNLPAEVQVAFAPTPGAFSASFVDEQGQHLRQIPVTVQMDAANRCGVGWVRTHSATQIGPSAPNADLKK